MGMADATGILPVYNLDGNNNASNGWGEWIWIIVIFAILGWGGNGFGGFGTGNSAIPAMNGISNEFLYSNLNGSLGRLSDSVSAGFQGLNSGMCDLGYSMLGGFKDLTSSIDNCCCATQRSIDNVRYDLAKSTCDIINANNINTRDIIEATNSGTQRIVDMMTQTQIQDLRDNLNTANLQLSQQAQSANIISSLRPTPMPAYITCSPYASALGNCGCGTMV